MTETEHAHATHKKARVSTAALCYLSVALGIFALAIITFATDGHTGAAYLTGGSAVLGFGVAKCLEGGK